MALRSQQRSKAASQSRTIRVSQPVYDDLTRLAQQHDRSINEEIAELLREQEKQRFFAEMREAYANLRADPEAWAEYQAEMAEWDATLADGLADLEWNP